MKTMDNKTNGPEACPDAAVMVAYCSGKLSPGEQHKLELHVLDCPFCEEALEGIQLLQHPEQLHQLQDQLHQAISEKSKKGRVITVFTSGGFRIAAILSIVLLSVATLIYFLPDANKNSLTLDKAAQEPASTIEIQQQSEPAATVGNSTEEKVPSVTTTEENLTSPASADNMSHQVISEVSGYKAETMTDEITEAESASGLAKAVPEKDDERQVLTAVESDSKTGIKEVTSEIPAAEPSEHAGEKIFSDEPSSTTITTTKNKSAVPAASAKEAIYQQGLQLFNEKKYSEALSRFRQTTGKPESRLYEGRCYFELKNYREAVNTFTVFLAGTPSAQHETAWWFKALSQKQLNDTDGAKKSLLKVIAFHGQYEQQAMSLLRTLP